MKIQIKGLSGLTKREYKDISGDFEWTATVYNLNRGKNDDLLERCKPLSDYMELVNRIRDNQRKGMNVRNAIDNAVDSCIADGIMKDFLVKHKAEVLSVCITEFDEKVYTDGIREEGREEGRKEGRAEGREEGRRDDIIRMLKSNKSSEQIAEFCGYDLEYVKKIQEEILQPDQK